MKLFYLAIALFIFSNNLKAEEVGYEVEVIIFEDSTGTYENTEIWQDKINDVTTAGPITNIIKENTDKNGNLQSSSTIKNDDERYVYISNDKLRLTNQAKKLNANTEYNVLYHRAWKQIGLDREQAFPVHIDSRDPQNIETLNKTADDANDAPGNYIDGSITLIMSRYLHINTDLVYHKHTSREGLSFTDYSTPQANSLYKDFAVKFERRMRSREIHYIDHPMVGIIVLATPYKILEQTTPNSPNTKYKSL